MAPAPAGIRYDAFGRPLDPNGNPLPPDALTPQNQDPNSPPAGPAGPPPAAQPPGSIYGNPGGATLPPIQANAYAPLEQQFQSNRNLINAQGSQLSNEAISAGGFYGSQLPALTGEQNQALSDLKTTPGYTPGESGQINTDYSKFNSSPADLAAIKGDPTQAQAKTEQGTAGEGAMLNQYQAGLGAQVGANATGVEGAAGKYGSGVGDAVSGLKSDISGSQNFDQLNSAVNNPNLAFDPSATEKQLSDSDVQSMKTAAGQRIGSQYRGAEDKLEADAAQAGNTSPLALAAARSTLMRSEASDQGQAESNADIQARQAQFSRAQGIEGQREGATQTQAGMQATAGTTEEAARQAGATTAGVAGIGAAENVGGATLGAAEDVGAADINAANQYGEFSTNTQADIGKTNAAAANTADTEASNRAATTTGMQYNQGTGSAQLTAGGAEAVGGARIAGEGAYRSGVAGQQQIAQTGGNEALQSQNATYGTEASGLNSSAAAQGNFAVAKPSFGDQLASGVAKALTTPPPVAPGGAEGDIVTEPETRTIGEAGPEAVIPLGGQPPQQPSRWSSVGHTLGAMALQRMGPAGAAISSYQRYRNANRPGGATYTGLPGTHPMGPQPNPQPDYAMDGPQPDSFAHGQIVTQPMVARLGDKINPATGKTIPEAVVPLNNSPHNHVNPELLEGHLSPPKLAGMKYSRYKGFSSPAY